MCAVVCLVAGGAAFAADTIDLRVTYGSVEGEVALQWAGGGVPFGVFRSANPINVGDPANQIGQTSATQWSDLPPNARIIYYVVLGPHCPAGLIPCGGACVDPLTDAQNCGGCGIGCDDNSACTRDLCSGGTCRRVDRAACANTDGGCGPLGCGACGFAAVYPGCPNPDTDGDGLGDTWEDAGAIDIDCDGDYDSNDVTIPDANALVKDVYLRIGWMGSAPNEPDPEGHRPSDQAIQRVVAAFAGSHLSKRPVRCDPSAPACPLGYSCSAQDFVCLPMCNTGPDCPTGVCVGGMCRERRLHVDIAPGGIPHRDVLSIGPVQPACVTGGDISKGVDFYDIKAQVFDPKEALFKRFGVFGHSLTCDSVSTCGDPNCHGAGTPAAAMDGSGGAEIGGNDFSASLGGFRLALDAPTKSLQEAGALMHELGHNLGLRHRVQGGAGTPVIPRQPNHISVMDHSYIFGIPGALTPGSVTPSPDPGWWRVDFSHSALATLDELNLSETQGVGPGHPPAYSTDLIRYLSPGFGEGTRFGSTLAGQPINWKVDDPVLSSPVQVNINDDPVGGPPSDVMQGAEDWSRLEYAFQCRPGFADGGTTGEWEDQEIDPSTAARYDLLLPPLAPGIDVERPCIDLGNNTVVPVTLFGSADFDVQQIVLTSLRLAEAPTVDASMSDKNGDGYLDLTALVRSADMVLTAGDMLAVARGKTLEGRTLLGEDQVHVASPPETCGFTCPLGTGDCNGMASDACETNLAGAQSNSPDLFGGGDVRAGYARVPVVTHCGGCYIGCDDGNPCTTDLCVPAQGLGECRHYDRAQCSEARCAGYPGVEPECASAMDADADGLPVEWETPQTDPYSLAMQSAGVDLNCNGEIGDADGDLIWHEPPAGDSRKDIYLEIDIMSNADGTGRLNDPILGVFPEGANPHPPPVHPSTGKSAVQEVREAFTRAGVTLHVDPVLSEVAHHQIIYLSGLSPNLTCSELVDSTTGEPSVSLDSFKDTYSDPRRRLGYHYAISGHNSCSEFAESSPLGSPSMDGSGTAEIGGNDMIISLANSRYYKQQFCVDSNGDGVSDAISCCSPLDCCLGDETNWDPGCGTILPIRATPYSCEGAAGFEVCVSGAHKLLRFQEWAGTLMHELGHNLGLCHGGIADVTNEQPCGVATNYAPNNISTMNYTFQLSGIFHDRHDLIDEFGNIIVDTVPPRRLDFSRGVELSLDEACLDETQGLGIDTWPWSGDRSRYYCGSNAVLIRSGPVDWNCDGDIDTGCVSADINNDGITFGLLPSVNEWGNLFYGFQCLASSYD